MKHYETVEDGSISKNEENGRATDKSQIVSKEPTYFAPSLREGVWFSHSERSI